MPNFGHFMSLRASQNRARQSLCRGDEIRDSGLRSRVSRDESRATGDEMKKAFTLVEILIVVAVLGILAAIALPTFKSHTQQAKEAAAKDSLRILRNAIELYAAQHNNVPPGCYNEELGSFLFTIQMIYSTNTSGESSGMPVKNDTHPLGPYISALPSNPFNNIKIVKVLGDNEEFLTDATGTFGWIYKPSTKTIKLNWSGTDTGGVPYFDY